MNAFSFGQNSSEQIARQILYALVDRRFLDPSTFGLVQENPSCRKLVSQALAVGEPVELGSAI